MGVAQRCLGRVGGVHVIAKGALIGGGVGAAFAAVRRPGEGAESGVAGRYVKSIAEGAVAGAGVGFLLDRRLRARAVELVTEHGPGLVDTVAEVLTDFAGVARERAEHAYDVARPRVAELAEVARDRAEQGLDAARPRVSELAELARDRAAQLRTA